MLSKECLSDSSARLVLDELAIAAAVGALTAVSGLLLNLAAWLLTELKPNTELIFFTGPFLVENFLFLSICSTTCTAMDFSYCPSKELVLFDFGYVSLSALSIFVEILVFKIQIILTI